MVRWAGLGIAVELKTYRHLKDVVICLGVMAKVFNHCFLMTHRCRSLIPHENLKIFPRHLQT